jgi:hypothetical protein
MVFDNACVSHRLPGFRDGGGVLECLSDCHGASIQGGKAEREIRPKDIGFSEYFDGVASRICDNLALSA